MAHFANLTLVTGDWQWKTYSGAVLLNFEFHIRAMPCGSTSDAGFLRYEDASSSEN